MRLRYDTVYLTAAAIYARHWGDEAGGPWDESPSGVQGQSPGRGSGDGPPEALSYKHLDLYIPCLKTVFCDTKCVV